MYSLASFSISDMTECASELRKLGAGASSAQEVAQQVVSYLYRQFGNDQTGWRDCALIRCYLTRPYRELDPQSQDCARRALGCRPGSLDMKCLTLFGTFGERPEWNERDRSRDHRSIPLADKQTVSRYPIVPQLLQQLGLELTSKTPSESDRIVDWAERTLDVFYEAEAKGSHFLPDQEGFIIPFGIESVLGFGGVLPSKELFAVILFSKQKISRETAELFKPLALSVKLALLPFDQSSSKRSIIRVESQPGRGQAWAEALEQLLSVHEQASAHHVLQRKQAREEVRNREEQFRQVFEEAPMGIIILDERRHCVRVNQAFCNLVGRNEAELIGREYELFTHPDDLQANMARTKEFFEGKRTRYRLEKRYIKKDGQVIWVAVNATTFRTPAQQRNLVLTIVEDITERKRVEEALRFAKFSVDRAADAVYWIDQQAKILDVNEAASLMLGYSKDELCAMTLHDLNPDFQADMWRGFWEETKQRGTMVVETVHRSKNGRLIPIEVSINYFSYEGKEYHCAFVRDITERKRAEGKLRESEAQLQAILDNSPGMVFLKDVEGRYLHVNRQFERAFHVTRERVVGKTDEAIFEPVQAAAFRANDLKVLQAGVPFEFEEVAMHDDGPHTSIVSKFPLYDGGGQLYAICGITTDITDRKRAEEGLRKSEDRYRNLFERAVEGIFQTTLDGKYVAVNPALAHMYGYDSPEDMIATITDIASQIYVDPGRRDEFICLMQEQEEFTGFEALVRRKDGSIIWTSENVRTVRDPSGVLVGYEGRVEDITERKRGEERLRATLEEVRMLSARLATVQEEERTRIARELHDELGVGLTCLKIDLSRLATIVGDGIGATARAKLDGKIRWMIEQVDGTIASVQRLVTQLRPALLDDLGLVAAIEWQCQDFQNRTGIPCTCVTSADDIAMEPERARALFRICQEALTNTARHAQATAVTIKLESRNDFLQLVVADNGVGIPDTKASDRQSLGLLGMKERAALFGGEITVQGHPDKGTTVTAYLPRRLR